MSANIDNVNPLRHPVKVSLRSQIAVLSNKYSFFFHDFAISSPHVCLDKFRFNYGKGRMQKSPCLPETLKMKE